MSRIPSAGSSLSGGSRSGGASTPRAHSELSCGSYGLPYQIISSEETTVGEIATASAMLAPAPGAARGFFSDRRRCAGMACLASSIVVIAVVITVAVDTVPLASPESRSRPDAPDDSGAASLGVPENRLLWSAPWIEQVRNGACEVANQVLQRPVCLTTTTTTTTTTGTTSTVSTLTSTSTTATTVTSTTSITTTTRTTTTLTKVTSTRTTTTVTTTTLTTSTLRTTPPPRPTAAKGHSAAPVSPMSEMTPLWTWLKAASEGKPIIKGISYAPVPVKTPGAVILDDDFMSRNASAFWGRKHLHDSTGEEPGRADLRTIRQLGANAVRLYGNDPSLDHRAFMDEAREQELDVIIGLSDYPYTQMHKNCMDTGWNCYEQIKAQYSQILRNGFLTRKGSRYHPGLKALILMNEPDLKFEGGLRGIPGDPRHFCRALLSAFDAVLDAEREAGVKEEDGVPNVTATFSFARCDRCGRFRDRPSLGQMFELRMAMMTPGAVGYVPRNHLWKAYQRRFVNSFNTANNAAELRLLFLDAYDAAFQGTPVFIGEYHSPPYYDQQLDLEGIMEITANKSTLLLGISFFEFQVRYDKGGGEMSFGMFGLGDRPITHTDIKYRHYTSWCLTPVRIPAGDGCRRVVNGTDHSFSSVFWSEMLDHIPNPSLCCKKCQAQARCQAWTWAQDAGLDDSRGPPSQCRLWSGMVNGTVANAGVVSGLPAHRMPPAEPRTALQLPPEPEADPEDSFLYLHDVVAQAYGGAGPGDDAFCRGSVKHVATTTLATMTTTTTVGIVLKPVYPELPPRNQLAAGLTAEPRPATDDLPAGLLVRRPTIILPFAKRPELRSPARGRPMEPELPHAREAPQTTPTIEAATTPLHVPAFLRTTPPTTLPPLLPL